VPSRGTTTPYTLECRIEVALREKTTSPREKPRPSSRDEHCERMPSLLGDIASSASLADDALPNIDAALALGDGAKAVRLVREAQRLTPSAPSVAVRLLEACLLDNQLMCAAHGARSLLRHASAEGDEDAPMCRSLGAAKAFGARAARLRWCWVGAPCGRLGNTSALDAASVSFPVGGLTAVDDGQLWSAEHLVAALKEMLADESQWQGGSGAPALNHATMQHVQGNAEVARGLYERVLERPAGAGAADAAIRAHAYANLGVLERAAPAARRHLDAALALAPLAPEAGERWTELARVHWQHERLPAARHALRRALALRPNAPFVHALAAELYTRRHEYGRAAAAAAAADQLQATRAPQLPQCARWSALLPRLPHLWGDARAHTDGGVPVAGAGAATGAGSSYRELIVGCGEKHAKLTGCGWHEEAVRWPSAPAADDAVRVLGALPDASVDEVHWCAGSERGADGGADDGADGDGADDAASGGAAEGGGVADRALGRDGWRAVWRVLRPSGLLQVGDAALAPPATLTSGEGALFRPLRLDAPGEEAAATWRAGVDAAHGEATLSQGATLVFARTPSTPFRATP
jgi:tetratricopeptide (TPR) repeat protein